MPSVVYITNVPFNKRDFARYGIADWHAEGYRVTVLDVGYFCLPTRDPAWDRVIYRDDSFELLVLRTKKELRGHSALLAGASLIVDLTTAEGHSRWNLPILRAIAKSGTPSLILSVNAYPGYEGRTDLRRSIFRRCADIYRRLRSADLINLVVTRLPFAWLGIRPADIVVYGGEKSRRPISTVTDGTLKLHGHHMDFDLLLEHRSNLSASGDQIPNEKIAVFIDQDFAGHREFANNSAVRPIDSDKYYALLCALFDRVEKRTGCRVVIARHPHSQTSDLADRLGARELVDGGTWDLIARSEIAIAHSSAAIAAVVLLRKPLLLIFSRDFEEAAEWRPGNNAALASVLARQQRYLEDLGQLTDAALFDEPLAGFEQYERNYITTEPDKQQRLWQFIVSALREHGYLPPPCVTATAKTGMQGI